MGRRSKSRAKSEDEEKSVKENHKSRRKSSFIFNESDDEEANEDLSLKIVEKAMSRSSNVANFDGEDIVTTELVTSESVTKKEKKEKRRKNKNKVKEVEAEIQMVTPVKEEDKVDIAEAAEVVKLSEEADGADNSNTNNDVLRMLLRGPRYFDPPDKSWGAIGACFNCGEDGHSAANCTSARRKKPCFICGSLEHEVKQCQKGKDCYICKGGDHRAKDCPKKFKRHSQASDLCLKCGASAHAMSTCKNDYSTDDLKDIQCYVCKRFGHLCCVDYFDALLSEASCYKCGNSGHNGQGCRGSRGETSSAGTPSSCFKCGEEGHFARECTTSSKAKKRTRDLSTPTKRYFKEYNSNKGFKSAPQDFGQTHKIFHYDNGSPNWLSKSNQRRGGWITDHPGDLPPSNGWRSPTPNKKHKIFGLTADGHGSNSQSSKRWGKSSSGTPKSQGYANPYQHRFSASRFGNSNSDGMRRNYDWW